MQIRKLSGTHHAKAMAPPVNAVSGSNMMAEFAAIARDGFMSEFASLNKLEHSIDLWNLRVCTFDTEPEHWGASKPPEDFPAPECVMEINEETQWHEVTQIGAASKANCDITASATSVTVYDGLNGPPPANVSPPGGGVIMIMDEAEHAHYGSRGATSYSQLVRGWDNTVPAPHYGHDMGAQNPGPPPVPPDTKHDAILMKKFSTSLTHFITMASEQTVMLPRPLNYSPSGSRNGIFMPIMLRYLAERRIVKTTSILRRRTVGGIG
jgi:hypothetical protein